VLPDVSVAVQVTVVVPTGKHEPEGGVHAVVTPGQLSLAVGAGKLTATHGLVIDGVFTVWFGGQVIVGGCVSLTVTVNVQVAVLLEESLTVQVTVVVPLGKNEPEAGEQPGAPTPGQLSLTVGGGYVAAAPHWLGSFDLVMFAGQVIVGGCVSLTVTVNVQFAIAPPESVAVHVTVVVPFEKKLPDAGEHVTVVPAQLSVGVGVGKVTTAPHWLGSFDLVMFAGQVIVGAGLLVVVMAVELLLAESGSDVSDVIEAVLLITTLPATLQFTVAVNVIVADPPLARDANVTVRLFPEPPQTPLPVDEQVPNVTCDGRLSVTTTFVAVDGPELRTVRV